MNPKSMSLKQFFLRRVLRLWPTMAVLFIMTFAINLVPPQFARAEWTDLLQQSLGVLFGVYNLLGSGSYYYGAMWSLSVEEQFYLAAPALMVFFAWTCRSYWRKVFRHFAFTFSLLLVVVRCAICFLPELASEYVPNFFGYLAGSKFDFLAYGVIFYLVSEGRPICTTLTRNTQRVFVIGGLIAPLVFAYFCGSPFDKYSDSPWLFTLALAVAGFGFTTAVGLAAGDRDLLRLFGRADQILLYLGSRSYGIYAFHFTLMVVGYIPIRIFMPWIFAKPALWYGVIQAVITIPIVLIVAELSYRFVERPCIRLSARLIAAMTKNGGGEKDVVEPIPESVKRAA